MCTVTDVLPSEVPFSFCERTRVMVMLELENEIEYLSSRRTGDWMTAAASTSSPSAILEHPRILQQSPEGISWYKTDAKLV